jgi:hypothetical protein
MLLSRSPCSSPLGFLQLILAQLKISQAYAYVDHTSWHFKDTRNLIFPGCKIHTSKIFVQTLQQLKFLA